MKHKQMYSLLMILSLTLSGCSLAPREEVLPEAPVIPTSAVEEYQKVEVLRGDIIESLSTKCTYTAFHTEIFQFPVDGIRIEHVYIEEGDLVKEGDLLADLDMNNINQQIEDISNVIELIDLKISNEKELKELVITNQDKMKSLDGYNMQLDSEFESELEGYDNAIRDLQDELSIERRRLELLYDEVSSRQIIAGMDGIVGYVSDYQEGELSDKERDFIKIYDPNTMVFVTDGSNSERLKTGQKVSIDVSGIEYQADIITPEELSIAGEGDIEKGKYLLKVDDPEKQLQSGDEGVITFILNEVIDTLYLPSSAVHSENGKSFVYIEDEGGFKSLKEIEIGIITEKKVEIKSGLNEGDSVIIN